ncbi:MAG: site-specific tyrosine recombinase XerC [Chloroflexi bacterium ADurb.Bin360]|nr:MAG: site-specific tyrosine recombinase XerC [Chloroflexi bacterium ADurb.Bin360]
MTTQLINRNNYHDILAYLSHCERVRHNGAETVKRKRGLLRHLLEWARDTPFPEAPGIPSHFANYLDSIGQNGQSRSDDKSGPLSPETKKKALEESIRLFKFYLRKDPQRYKSRIITDEWLASLKVVQKHDRIAEHEFYTLDEVECLVTSSPQQDTLTEIRIRAAIALLFLSGMRVGALVTMPLKAFDPRAPHPVIWQWGLYGVETKFDRPITTFLLRNLPSLTTHVLQWDDIVRTNCPDGTLWFTALSRDGTSLLHDAKPGRSRDDAIRKGLHQLCEQTGIPYRHPHCLRHGHIVYAMKRASNMEDMVAIAQNIGHEDVTTTLRVYGRLTQTNLQDTIARISAPPATSNATNLSNADIDRLVERLTSMKVE